jgi:putative transposase
MVNYRRNRVAGASYFFTLTLRDRRADTLTRHIDLLRAALAEVRRARPFAIEAVVVLPEHLHLLCTLPEGDDDYPSRLRAFKTRFVRLLAAAGEALTRNHRGETSVWQARYWEHTIRDEADFAAHCDYIHYNPVKHGHVANPAAWPYSSFARSVARGLYPADWGGQSENLDSAQRHGERG